MSMRLFIWGGHDRIDLIRDVAEAAGATITGVGAPTPKGSADLAEAFQVGREDELRSVIQREDSELLWLAGEEPVDPDIRRALWTSGIPVASTEPRPGAFGEVVESRSDFAVEMLPLFRMAPGMVGALCAVEAFGEVRAAQISARCPIQHGTLFARLFDAIDTACLFLGECLTAAATLCGPQREVPESPRALRGWLSAMLQFEGGRSASIMIGDLSPTWFRGLCLLCEGGVVRVTDTTCQTVADGGPPPGDDLPGATDSPDRLFAPELKRAAEGRPVQGPPPDHSRLLAICETARLSCRTGHTESTHTMLEMLAGP